MWPLGHVGDVTYSFINMLFIATGIFYDKLHPQIVSVDTTANSPLIGKGWNFMQVEDSLICNTLK